MKESKGFALITALLLSILMAGAVAILFWQVRSSALLGLEAEGQLHSQVVAENGLELARVALAASNLEDLLAGSNGRLDAPGGEACRDPVSLQAARSTDPARLSTDCDDGLFTNLGLTLGAPGYRVGPGEWVFLRAFNAGETTEIEDAGEVTVRSLGVCPAANPSRSPLEAANHITLVEARLRKEAGFNTESSINLVGSSILINWLAERPRQGDELTVSVVEHPFPGLLERVRQALSRSLAPGSFRLVDANRRLSEPAFLRLLADKFREGIDVRLKAARTVAVGQEDEPGLHYLPDGGLITGDASGLFFAFGHVALSGSAHLRGILIHMGGEGITLSGQARISGAIWMLSADHESRFTVTDQAGIDFDGESVESAMKFMPVTQIYWRLIFPELSG